jgi:hypothetical protein
MKPEQTATKSVARDTSGRFLPGHPVGSATRWRNASGNPAGNPRARREFEAAFYAALIGEGAPEEAAKLLWDCARNKEPWAIQALLGRLAPTETRLKISPETNNGTYDLSKLSDTELDTFIQLGARAAGGANAPARQLKSGEGTTPAA